MRKFRILVIVGMLVLQASGICSAGPAGKKQLTSPVIDDAIPAGNIVFEKAGNDTVYVHQDLRDTSGDWFYWAFRARGCQGRTLTFIFTRSDAVGVRGPVVSFDKGKTFSYADAVNVTRKKFTFTFPEDAREVWMYECFPYTPQMWDSFVKGIPHSIKYETGVLCKSAKGRDVPYFHIGHGKYKVVMTSRHHCSESTGTMVLEGVAAAFAEKSELGERLRAEIDLTIVPFVDIDGAQAGDQGKNRKPHDHNRDYDIFLYPETKAVADLMKEKSPVVFIDAHSPWLYGQYNEFIYTPMKNPKYVHDMAREARFSSLLEKNQEGGLRYKAGDDLPFGQSWNTGANYKQGASSVIWALMNIPSLEVCRSLEIPFANANGAVVTPEALKTFGRGLARAVLDYLTEDYQYKHKFVEASSLTLGGKMFPDTPEPYERLDLEKYTGFTEDERRSIRKSAGIFVLFRTNSTSIQVLADPVAHGDEVHSPYEAYGYDCYIKKDGKWLWAGCNKPTDKKAEAFRIVSNMDSSDKECLIYLPLYTLPGYVKIGVDSDSYIKPLDNPFKGRVGVFGSSYTHGGLISRPGLTYHARLARRSGIEFCQLGVSGVCRLQPAFADAIKDAPIDALLVDGFSNGAKVSEVLLPFIRTIRQARPGLPIIFLNSICCESGNFDRKRAEYNRSDAERNAMWVHKAMEEFTDIYLIDPVIVTDEGHDCSVDGIHPGDCGIALWADSIEKPLMEILSKYGL